MAQRDFLEKDYYKILGLGHDASKEEIKRAYRKLAQRHHPDANKDDKDAEARFKEISEAHAVLSNDEKRREYDQMRAFVESGGQRFYGFRPGAGNVRVNIGDIGDLFGEGAPGSLFEDLFGFRGHPGQGADVETEVELAFDDAVRGATVTLPGGGRARIPAGVADGARIKVAGKGEAGPPGATRGDLYVRVRVADHPVFKLQGKGNLLVTVPVTIAEAALGARIDVPTLEETVTVKVPPGTQNGKTLRVRGRGAPRARGGRGDLLVKIEVQVPQKLTRKEKELLEQFQEVHQESPRRHLTSYLRKNRSAEAS